MTVTLLYERTSRESLLRNVSFFLDFNCVSLMILLFSDNLRNFVGSTHHVIQLCLILR